MDDYSKAQKMEDMQEWLEILLPFLIVIAIAVIVGLIIGVSILAVKKKHQENALYGDESGQSVSQENAKVVSKRTARTNIAGVVQDVGFITFEFDIYLKPFLLAISSAVSPLYRPLYPLL